MSDVNFEEISTKVEIVKLGMRHTKDGHVVSFAINPHDTPQSLMTDPLGQRYLAVLVRLDGEDKPVASQSEEDGKQAIRLAGTLCSDEKFQDWLVFQGEVEDASEETASQWMRNYLDVMSRKELRFNKDARAKLAKVRNEFIAYLKSGVR